jgi:undecaprenyl-diphosphatase
VSALPKLSALDRAAGHRVRAMVGDSPRLADAAKMAAAGMAPAFQLLVGVMIGRRGSRGTGLVALASAAAASLLALALRERLGRPRPGPRPEGGMPSRHSATAAAIATAIATRRSLLGIPAWAGLIVGGWARVVSGDHEPGDIAAGALLGMAVGGLVARLAELLVGWRR